MKKLMLMILEIVMLFTMVGCRRANYDVKIVIPAGSEEKFVYSDEEICSLGKDIVLLTVEGLGDTEITLQPVGTQGDKEYSPTYITTGLPVKFNVEKDVWFKVGVSVKNPTNEDIVVYVNAKNVEIRIS